ncbi:MAG: DUF4330 domain-containing protein [Defluviitaleaceae bacterium]|nr:DUF4330 domain-containing protein [Defluviitaleaceae bacterium]
MDKNGKLFGKISIIDLAVILVVLVVAIGAIYRFTAPGAAVTRGDGTVNFTIILEGPRAFTLENYEPGLRVYDRRSNQFIGILTDFEYAQHYVHRTLDDGTTIQAAWPGHVDIYLHILAHGHATDTAIYVEGTYEIAANAVIQIRTRYVEVEGRVHWVDVAQ